MRNLAIALTLYLTFVSTSVFARNINASGVAVAESRNDACDKAMANAKREAVSEAGSYVSSKLESDIKDFNGETVKNLSQEIYQSSFGVAEVVNKKENTEYSNETGMITCRVEARFEVDTSAVQKELEARVAAERAKAKQSEQKIVVMEQLENNRERYLKLKREAQAFNSVDGRYFSICKHTLSMKQCSDELIGKMQDEERFRIAEKLGVAPKFVNVKFERFDGSKSTEEIDRNSFRYVWQGAFSYTVNLDDPYVNDNQNLMARMNTEAQLEQEMRDARARIQQQRATPPPPVVQPPPAPRAATYSPPRRHSRGRSATLSLSSYSTDVEWDNYPNAPDEFGGVGLHLTFASSNSMGFRLSLYSTENTSLPDPENWYEYSNSGFDYQILFGQGLKHDGPMIFGTVGYFMETWTLDHVSLGYGDFDMFGLMYGGGIGFNMQGLSVEFSVRFRSSSDYEDFLGPYSAMDSTLTVGMRF